ncbi:MauE/DoxX family redox-associated membrane protein [Nocardia sp. NPDC051832]|uniref:MauE/DoxX family redox-associated membrane protein n=1 Tax=Nocardia sp. NPDC051832 TaxID=3155673 RepID=UPI003427FCAA
MLLPVQVLNHHPIALALLLLITRFALALTLLRAGLAKLGDPHRFRDAVTSYALLPALAVRPVAATVTATELGCGTLLITGILPAPAAIITAILLTIFAAAMALNLAAGRRIDCGCAGADHAQPISWALITRNLALAALAVVVAIVPVDGLAILTGPHPRATMSVAPEIAWASLLTVLTGSVGWQLTVRGHRVTASARKLTNSSSSGR